MEKNQNLVNLNEVGQSVWYDNLSRDVLNSGELVRLIQSGVTGLTSNPTIFKKAIADSSDYDSNLKDLLSSTSDSEELCEKLMIDDVAAAADLLRQIYDDSKGLDGHASIEVSPFLADDTQGTIEAGKRLWSALNRPNIMIKVPATDAGIPAIKELLKEGINVNVTLIFSVETYLKVMDAFVQGIQARIAAGKPVDRVASVASFFVSRVDAICEKKAVELGVFEAGFQSVFGKIGIANSLGAYQAFLDRFSRDDAKEILSKGAQVQRPLWASVGTKNPKFSAVLYIEELAGPNTVSTMPPETLNAVLQGVAVSDHLSGGDSESQKVLAETRSLGIDFEGLLVDLQKAGVESFAQSYRDLLSSIEGKVKQII